MSLRQPSSVFTYRGHVLDTPPVSEPVTAAALKDYLVDNNLSDADALLLIAEAREMVETANGVAIMPQKWRLVLDDWPDGVMPWWDGLRDGSIRELRGRADDVELPRWPLTAVNSITVYDDADNAVSVDVGVTFVVDTYRVPGRIALRNGATWPIALRTANAVQIVYSCGFTSVPAAIKRAVLQLAAYLYTHRGDCDGANGADPYSASGAGAIMAKFRVVRV